MVKHNIRIAIVNLLKNRRIAGINIFGLTVGMTCVILISLWVVHELSYESFFSKSDRIYLVSTKKKNSDSSHGSYYTSYAVPNLLAKSFPGIETYTHFENYSNFRSCMLKGGNTSDNNDERFFYEDEFYIADSSFFRIFDFPFIYGSSENAFSHLNSIVLSEQTAQKYFGDTNPVGEILTYNNNKEFKVTGVARVPDNTQLGFNAIVINSTLREAKKLNGWDSNGPSFVMLKENVSVADFKKSVYNYLNETETPLTEEVVVDLVPISETHTMYGLKALIFIILSVAVLILIIGSLNYINLSTALFAKRSKQIAITKIHGANKTTISLQLITESVLITYISLAISLFLTKLLLPYFNNLTETELSFQILGPFQLIAIYFLSFGLIVGAISGMFPAITIASKKPLLLVNPVYKSSLKGIIGRRFMVIFQFFISISLICATLFILKQRITVDNQPLGFDKDYVVQLPINKQLNKNFSGYYNELTQNPNIISVTAASTIPASIGNHSPIKWGTGPDEIEKNCKFAIVKPGYLQTFGMELLEGKPFDINNPDKNSGYIINEAAAKRIGRDNIVGETINFWGREGEVIGIVKDFQNNWIVNSTMPLILSANPDHQFFAKYIFVKINPNNIQETLADLRTATNSFAPEFPFEYSFIDEKIDMFMRDGIRFNELFFIFSIAAILISLLGVFGMIFFVQEKRTKEIGVRKVNGASVQEILKLVNIELLQCIAIAFILSVPLVYFFIKNWMEQFANKTELSWWIFPVAGIIALIMAFITVSWQSWKAATLNPVEALRNE